MLGIWYFILVSTVIVAGLNPVSKIAPGLEYWVSSVAGETKFEGTI